MSSNESNLDANACCDSDFFVTILGKKSFTGKNYFCQPGILTAEKLVSPNSADDIILRPRLGIGLARFYVK